jgi:hypothetical protein
MAWPGAGTPNPNFPNASKKKDQVIDLESQRIHHLNWGF